MSLAGGYGAFTGNHRAQCSFLSLLTGRSEVGLFLVAQTRLISWVVQRQMMSLGSQRYRYLLALPLAEVLYISRPRMGGEKNNIKILYLH